MCSRGCLDTTTPCTQYQIARKFRLHPNCTIRFGQCQAKDLCVSSRAAKRLAAKQCAAVVQTRGAVGRKHRIVHGSSWPVVVAHLPPVVRWLDREGPFCVSAILFVGCLSHNMSKAASIHFEMKPASSLSRAR